METIIQSTKTDTFLKYLSDCQYLEKDSEQSKLRNVIQGSTYITVL